MQPVDIDRPFTWRGLAIACVVLLISVSGMLLILWHLGFPLDVLLAIVWIETCRHTIGRLAVALIRW